MDTLSFTVLTTIGETGIGTMNDVAQHLSDLNVSRGEVATSLRQLRDEGFLTSSAIKFGARGDYNFNVFELTASGHSWYVEQYQQTAVSSEAAYMRKTYGSLEAGYLIRNTCRQFDRLGFSVDHIPGSHTLTLFNPKDTSYITVITDKHEYEWYEALLDDLYEQHSAVFFLSPNEQLLYASVKMHFFKWIANRFGTIDDVPPGFSIGFSTYHYLHTDKPFRWDLLHF